MEENIHSRSPQQRQIYLPLYYAKADGEIVLAPWKDFFNINRVLIKLILFVDVIFWQAEQLK